MLDILSIVIGLAIGFILGNLSYYLIVNRMHMTGKNWLMIVVSVVWTFSIIAEILIPAYTTNFAIHVLMGAIVGGFFDLRKAAEGIIKR